MELNYRFNNLCSWVTDNGGFVNKNISIDYSKNEGKFIKASGLISKGEELFRIPNNILLNKENSNLDINSGSERGDTIISLLFEIKKEESFWEPYLSILPEISDFSEHPLLLLRNGKIFPNFANYNLSVIYNEYVNIRDYILKSNIFNVIFDDEIFWAFLVVSTRMWRNRGLVPIADLFQHSYMSEIKLQNDSEFSKMTADIDFNTGEKIYDNYNIYDDNSLFFIFGFLQETKHQYLTINVDYDKCKDEEKKIISLSFKKSVTDDIISHDKKIELDNKFIIFSIQNFDKGDFKNENINELDSLKMIKSWVEESFSIYSPPEKKFNTSEVIKLERRMYEIHTKFIELLDNQIKELSI